MPQVSTRLIMTGMMLMKNLLKSELNVTGRILFVTAALLLIVSLLFPWWYLKLVAPQYQEGLTMSVYAYKIDGRIDIINNLNHYIGMKEISPADFPELKLMPYIVGAVAFLALLTAVSKRAWLGLLTFILAGSGGALGLYDCWRWLHKYGTELDPHAPITIPPFTPPIIGVNHLANFTTYTGFGIGGYLLFLGIMLMPLVLWRFRQWREKPSSSS